MASKFLLLPPKSIVLHLESRNMLYGLMGFQEGKLMYRTLKLTTAWRFLSWGMSGI